MFFKKSGTPSGQIGSLIGAGTRIIGDVAFVGGLRVDGEVAGSVHAPGIQSGTLVLGRQARVEGKVTAARVLIDGTVVGPTIATEFVELQPHARISGNIYYNGIAMQPGAVVDGRLVHCISNKSSGELELVYGESVTAAKAAVTAQS